MVDLARVVEVMLDHHRDDPARLLRHAPVRHARAKQLGVIQDCDTLPEPLLAPPAGQHWAIRWSSQDTRYGGCGTAPPDTEENWRIPGEAAVVLAPAVLEDRRET